ncbi:uncharacterized protein F5891DRAFT_1218431 [Suillus fuscotomentosus]|uniref:CxC2-like cysteine cluster KDZ transposase-associated domain-containing protein n=1 Tax=Suillus fuscotomentosus TaxID=1912939 RepID=A0AAD4DPG3_9AGAM|nr:uncharacterized protein F5891DRAFT_1218431 [Suillus fuscotomentosus]KAG1888001.1 hypothetical protein F5891DRAFT_1218431 [Suillus fuscotomentosus]
MTDAYLEWSLAKYKVGFTGFFDQLHREDTHLENDTTCGQWTMSVVDAFCILPCSPTSLMVGITTEVLEFYRIAFVKSLCDLRGAEFHRHLSCQFSIAFDLYLQVRRCVAAMVAKSLRRDSPDWRLKHVCPACTYELVDEEDLTFKLLYAMDGNDSLKRVLRWSLDHDGESLGPSSELPTGQQLTSDRYLPRTFVNQFASDISDTTAVDNIIVENEPTDNSCAGRWKNMDDAKTKKAWGIYDETGIFVAVCRHGFSLVIADMVQSGELAKYPLAVVSKLMDVFGKQLGGGYDIGCQFKTTLDNSSIGPLARSLQHTCLVGAFHGHAHRRLCQLFSLTTYIKGLGLEDLETCERTFSKSNSLASALRYASVFHRQQAIDSLFRAQRTTSKYTPIFTVFEQWLEEEKVYLQSLTREPEDETVADGILAKVDESYCEQLSRAHLTWRLPPETARWHALEDYERHIKVVQALECKLEVEKRWTPEDPQWQKVGRLVANQKYQHALDRLEGLIVARIFELTKMNRAGTGYKLRKHIAKALQTRSVAIRSALNTYNSIASSMYPPRQTLKWEDVVEYAFLADFDLLHDTRADVSRHPWSSPGARSAMDLYFKMCRAREEIQRLNIETRRLATYIQDEDIYLRRCEDQLKDANPALAHQVALHRNIRGRFNSRHLNWLYDISRLSGFSGIITPGASINTSLGDSANNGASVDSDTQDDLDGEEEEEEVAEEVSRSLQDVLRIADDFSQLELHGNTDDES